MAIIYFDMDGTLADFYKGDWLADLMASNPRPYATAGRLIEQADLERLASNGYELGIISWLSKNGTPEFNKLVRQAKKKWLASNYPNIHWSEIHIVKYGTPKHYVCKQKWQCLVDDEKPNRDKWHGLAIEPTDLHLL